LASWTVPLRGQALFAIAALVYCAALISGQAATFTGRVVVIDGDTIGVMRHNREVRVRLEGINAPEDARISVGARNRSRAPRSFSSACLC
jgi:endonuclease YncB( thermonuclease family)